MAYICKNINDDDEKQYTDNIPVQTNKEILTQETGKITNMYDIDGNFLRSFPSTGAAARYMIENRLTDAKFGTIKHHIREVCTGIRQTAANFKWKYNE